MSTWTRADRLTLLGIMVAVLGILFSLTNPELRESLGLAATPPVESTQAADQETPTRILPQADSQESSNSGVPQADGDITGTLDRQVEATSSVDSQANEQVLASELAAEPTDNLAANTPPSPAKMTPKQPVQSTSNGIFTFDLLGCERVSDLVRCSLLVKNLAEKKAKMNLCGASYIVDDMGRQPRTKVRFSGGNSCGVFKLEPSLPRALEMTAEIPVDSGKLNIVLADGNWFSFSGTVTFRDVPIFQAGPK